MQLALNPTEMLPQHQVELALQFLMQEDQSKLPEQLKNLTLPQWTMLEILLDYLLEEQSMSTLH